MNNTYVKMETNEDQRDIKLFNNEETVNKQISVDMNKFNDEDLCVDVNHENKYVLLPVEEIYIHNMFNDGEDLKIGIKHEEINIQLPIEEIYVQSNTVTVKQEVISSDDVNQLHYSQAMTIELEQPSTSDGNKLYTCSYCDKQFSNLHDKSKNERIHTGEQPYLCSYCEISYSVLSNKIHT